MVADMNKGFTQEELAFIQTQQLPLPAEGPNYAKQILDKSGEINKKLGQKKSPFEHKKS